MQELWSEIISALTGGSNFAINEVGLGALLFLTVVSLVASLLIANLYLHFCSSRGTGRQIYRAFPLVGLSITAIFVTIQFSLPLSIGLLGALSIVRFRTPIKEPEEIGFIVLVVAAAAACATFKLAFVGIILLVALAALIMQGVGSRHVLNTSRPGLMVISVPAGEYAAHATAIAETVERRLHEGWLESLSSTNGKVVLSYNFTSRSPQSLTALGSDLRDRFVGLTCNVFFDRP
jgi:hypothetical protein